MSANEQGRSSISKATSYEEIGQFWDTHDLTEYAPEGDFVEAEARFVRRHQVAVADDVYRRLESESARQGVAPETLVNLWLMERLHVAERESGEAVLAEKRGPYAAE